MAVPMPPTPKTTIGKIFLERTRELREHAQDEHDALQCQSPPKWYRPATFTAEKFDIPAYHPLFNIKQQEDEFVLATKDPANPGTCSGDFEMVLNQGEWLQQLERAFRMRNHSTNRRRLHACGRYFGHKSAFGIFIGGMIGYVGNINLLNLGEFALNRDDSGGHLPATGGPLILKPEDVAGLV